MASKRAGAPSAAKKLVVIGDLNGAYDALREILRGTGLIDGRERWVGGRSELVQLGDIFNRGGGARRAFELLLRLKRRAARAGGSVHILLGNHEVMTALGNEAYCTEAEYLSFAGVSERKAWSERVARAARRLFLSERRVGRISPFEPRLEAWKALHAPGQRELRRELGPRGKLGQALRKLPLVHVTHSLVCVHGGLLPRFAELGVDALNALLDREWQRVGRRRYLQLPRGKETLFRNSEGPLWERSLARGGRSASVELRRSLTLLGASRMVVGHTPTEAIRGGEKGSILLLHAGRLVLVDVGLAEGSDAPRAALVVQGKRGFEWTPNGTRLLWDDRRVALRPGQISRVARARGRQN